MRACDVLLKSIRRFEGFRGKAYQDAKGVWTIGYGHTRGVKQGDKISKSLAEEYLKADIKPIERQLNNTFPWLKQNEFDALVSFIFNLGYYAFESSTHSGPPRRESLTVPSSAFAPM